MAVRIREKTFEWSLASRLSYVLWRKHYTGGLPARLRCFWHVALRRYETEICEECGGPVGLVWWCDDDELWERVTGQAKTLGSREAAGGIWCTPCFDAGSKKLGIVVRWHPRVLVEK